MSVRGYPVQQPSREEEGEGVKGEEEGEEGEGRGGELKIKGVRRD